MTLTEVNLKILPDCVFSEEGIFDRQAVVGSLCLVTYQHPSRYATAIPLGFCRVAHAKRDEKKPLMFLSTDERFPTLGPCRSDHWNSPGKQ